MTIIHATLGSPYALYRGPSGETEVLVLKDGTYRQVTIIGTDSGKMQFKKLLPLREQLLQANEKQTGGRKASAYAVCRLGLSGRASCCGWQRCTDSVRADHIFSDQAQPKQAEAFVPESVVFDHNTKTFGNALSVAYQYGGPTSGIFCASCVVEELTQGTVTVLDTKPFTSLSPPEPPKLNGGAKDFGLGSRCEVNAKDGTGRGLIVTSVSLKAGTSIAAKGATLMRCPLADGLLSGSPIVLDWVFGEKSVMVCMVCKCVCGYFSDVPKPDGQQSCPFPNTLHEGAAFTARGGNPGVTQLNLCPSCVLRLLQTGGAGIQGFYWAEERASDIQGASVDSAPYFWRKEPLKPTYSTLLNLCNRAAMEEAELKMEQAVEESQDCPPRHTLAQALMYALTDGERGQNPPISTPYPPSGACSFISTKGRVEADWVLSHDFSIALRGGRITPSEVVLAVGWLLKQFKEQGFKISIVAETVGCGLQRQSSTYRRILVDGDAGLEVRVLNPENWSTVFPDWLSPKRSSESTQSLGSSRGSFLRGSLPTSGFQFLMTRKALQWVLHLVFRFPPPEGGSPWELISVSLPALPAKSASGNRHGPLSSSAAAALDEDFDDDMPRLEPVD